MSNEYKSEIVTGVEDIKLGDTPNVQEDVKMAINQVQADWESLRKQEKDKFITDHKVDLQDYDLTIFSKPRSGCKHCHSRGIMGFYDDSSTKLPGEPAICRCLTNLMVIRGELPDTNRRLTYGQFRSMLAKAREVYNLKEPEDEQDNTVGVDSVQSDVQKDSKTADTGGTV